ncbi:hypothetical protein C0J52_22731, partial [Blattella germanica]
FGIKRFSRPRGVGLGVPHDDERQHGTSIENPGGEAEEVDQRIASDEENVLAGYEMKGFGIDRRRCMTSLRRDGGCAGRHSQPPLLADAIEPAISYGTRSQPKKLASIKMPLSPEDSAKAAVFVEEGRSYRYVAESTIKSYDHAGATISVYYNHRHLSHPDDAGIAILLDETSFMEVARVVLKAS